MERTVLVQERIPFAMDAIDRFSRGGNRVPLVLVPEERWPCSLAFTVPSGVNCIMQRFGKDVGDFSLAEPGLSCRPYWYKIAYCVTPSSNTYNAPVKQCPTSDCVRINCDLTLVFSISNDPKSVKAFVYSLGAHRFNEFLAAATEEGIRQLVRETPHNKVYELRGGSQVSAMLKELNHKFEPFGVTFQKVAITDVQFHGNLSHTLEETTEFDSKIKEHKKSHEFLVKSLDFKADQSLEEETKKIDRTLQDLEAAAARAKILHEQQEIEARAQFSVAVTDARERASVQEARAQSQKLVADFEGKRKADALIATAKTKSQEIRIAVEQATRREIFESEKRVEEAKDLADALKIEAAAEGEAADKLKKIRAHQLQLDTQSTLGKIGRNGKIMVSGDNGDTLIAALMKGVNGHS